MQSGVSQETTIYTEGSLKVTVQGEGKFKFILYDNGVPKRYYSVYSPYAPIETQYDFCIKALLKSFNPSSSHKSN